MLWIDSHTENLALLLINQLLSMLECHRNSSSDIRYCAYGNVRV